MTNNEPRVRETGRYTITEASEKLGIHRNTLLRYTEQGQIRCGFRRETARKSYTGYEILRFLRAQM